MILNSKWSRNFQSYCWENIIVFRLRCDANYTVINNYLKEDHCSYRRKRLSFPKCKSCVYNCRWSSFIKFFTPQFPYMIFIYFDSFIRKQFHSVNGTEISHMKIWREPKSLSARLIPVLKHCEHLCVGIYSEGPEKHGAAWNNPPYTKPAFSKILL